MPELPEVETIRRVLAEHLAGARITEVRCLRQDVLGGASPAAFAAALRGARFRCFGRRGKYLLLWLEAPAGGAAGGPLAAEGTGRVPRLLVIHLRMTGRLTLARRDDPPAPHTHVIFSLAEAGSWEELRFSDPRRFGRLYLLDPAPWAAVLAAAEWGGSPAPTGLRGPSRGRSGEAAAGAGGAAPGRGGPRGLAELGPEPLGPGFSARALARRLAGRRAPVKALLLDQRVVAGLGNIYADEALFRAGIDPARPAGTLEPEETRRLARAIRRVLRDALAAGGTTFSDYRDGLGRQGEFARRLAVYGRAGEPCPRCGAAIATRRLGGRTAHYCPRCQR